MGGGADRRPWLILSRREAVALRDEVLGALANAADLARALHMIDLQLGFIDDGVGEVEDLTPTAALLRDRHA